MENNQEQNEKEEVLANENDIVSKEKNKSNDNSKNIEKIKKTEEKPKKQKKKEKQKKSFARETMEWILSFFIAFAAALIIKYFIFTPTLVKQESMTPTILNEERVLINRLARTFGSEYKRGDIITFEAPIGVDLEKGVAEYNSIDGISEFFRHEVLEHNKTSYIKRVIGVAGDHVLIKDGNVYVNGEMLKEEYLREDVKTPEGEFYDVKVPEGYLFAMGDNRTKSTDCRSFGCVPLEQVEGRVTFRIWPLNKFGKIDK